MSSLSSVNLIYYYWESNNKGTCNCYQLCGHVLLTPPVWQEVLCHWEPCELEVIIFCLVARWCLPGSQSRWCCNLVSQCVGASDLWPLCLSVELPFDCFIPSRALEPMLMSKVLIYQSIRRWIQLGLLKTQPQDAQSSRVRAWLLVVHNAHGFILTKLQYNPWVLKCSPPNPSSTRHPTPSNQSTSGHGVTGSAGFFTWPSSWASPRLSSQTKAN